MRKITSIFLHIFLVIVISIFCLFISFTLFKTAFEIVHNEPDYIIYAVDENGIQQVEKFVVVPNSSITCPNDLKLQEPRYIFIEAEK